MFHTNQTDQYSGAKTSLGLYASRLSYLTELCNMVLNVAKLNTLAVYLHLRVLPTNERK